MQMCGNASAGLLLRGHDKKGDDGREKPGKLEYRILLQSAGVCQR